jgi:hypothetical protein
LVVFAYGDFYDFSVLCGQDSRLVYKHYATLYFVFVFDSSENELAMLDLIQGTTTFTNHDWMIWKKWIIA